MRLARAQLNKLSPFSILLIDIEDGEIAQIESGLLDCSKTQMP
jgi:hypothetical protein